MKFRTRFLALEDNEYTGEVTQSTLAVPAFAVVNGLHLLVKVGGVVVVNTTTFNTFSTASVVHPDLGTITATGFADNGLRLDIPLANVWDKTTVEIVASNNLFYTFNSSFEVYGYDLGNDPIGGITTNPDMDIIMMYDWSNEASQSGNAYSKFVAYRKPFSNKIYFYNLTSQPAIWTYLNALDSDSVILTGFPNGFICNNENASLKLKSELAGGFYTITDALDVDAYASLKLPYSVETECPTCATSCYTFGENINAYTIFNNNPSFQGFYVDDVLVPPYDTITILYELFDVFGNLVASQTIDISITLPFTPDAGNYPFTGISLSEVGGLILKTTLSVEGLFSCVTTDTLSVCNTLKIDKTDCSSYKFTNITLNDVTLEVYKITSSTSLATSDNTLVVNELVGGAENVIVNFEDGLYIIIIDDNTIQFLPVYCNLETCLLNFSKKLMCATPTCGGCGTCDDCVKKESDVAYNFNALSFLAFNYFAILQTNYFFSQVFSLADYNINYASFPKDIQKLFDLSTILSKALEYCEVCGYGTKTNSVTSSVNSTTNDCGCS